MHDMFQKKKLFKNSRSPLFIGGAGLQYTVCNATRNELLTKFLKECFETYRKFPGSGLRKGPYQIYLDLQIAAFNLACFQNS